MGYNGKIDKNKRYRSVTIDEANRVINTGHEMLDIVKELKEQSKERDPNMQHLNMRIAIHTGKIIAGIIGSKIVRYDIFGEGVLFSNKMKSNSKHNFVCVS